MYEHRRHLVHRMRHQRVAIYDDAEYNGTHREDIYYWEQPAEFPWRPHIEDNENVYEVAKVKEEVVLTMLSIRVPTIGQQQEKFLKKIMEKRNMNSIGISRNDQRLESAHTANIMEYL